MYAIVDIAGQQFKVEKDQQLHVHRLDTAEGAAVIFDQVLLVDDNGTISVGKPQVIGAGVVASVVEHIKGDKVLVFHKKRRKGYEKLNGHRDALSKILIQDISLDIEKLRKSIDSYTVAPKAVKAEKAPVKKVAAKKIVAKVEKAETVVKAEKAPAKKVAKAPAVKKPAAKKAKSE